MMKILVGSGLVFPPHDRVEPHVQVFNIPFYVVGCEATAEPTQSCSVFTTNVNFTLRTYVQMQVLCVYIRINFGVSMCIFSILPKAVSRPPLGRVVSHTCLRRNVQHVTITNPA